MRIIDTDKHFVYLFLIFERISLLLVVHLFLLMEVPSRQRVLLCVSGYWLVSLKETELNIMELSTKQWTGSVNQIST